jgi:DNA-binding transcriptional regulator YdaS (Cro superfamily)
MKLNEWLDEKRGRVKLVTEHFGLSSGAVPQWRTNGVPKEHMLALKKLTKGRVKLEDMLPENIRKEP